jgi:hypothetical protein
MPKSRLLDRLRRPPISYQEFMQSHEEAKEILEFLKTDGVGHNMTLAQLRANPPRVRPLPPPMEALKNHPFFQLLRAASREDCPDAYIIFLDEWLSKMWVGPPEGVLREPRRKSGRRRDRQTDLIYERWEELGRPTLGRRRLASAVYGPLFTQASSAERKKMVDRCRRAVERTIQRMRPNSKPL